MPWLRKVRWQFSLASLMGCVLVVAVGASLYGAHLRAIAAEKRAFEQIAAKGGNIYIFTKSGGQRRVVITFISRDRIGMDNAEKARFIHKKGTPSDFAGGDLTLFDDVRNLDAIRFPLFAISDQEVADFQKSHPHVRCSR